MLKALDLKGPLVAFEITLDALPLPKAKPTKMKPKLALSDFQPVTRDFAFVVGRDVAAGDIVKAAQGAERQLVAGVDVFDVYEGAGIDPDKKSVAIAVTLQPTEKTLTDAEIEAVSRQDRRRGGEEDGSGAARLTIRLRRGSEPDVVDGAASIPDAACRVRDRLPLSGLASSQP